MTITNTPDVGNSGTGTLEVEGKGTVSSGDASIGRLAGSNGQALVSGLGSKWLVAGDLQVGDAGTGNLVVNAGGSVVSSNGDVGNWLGPPAPSILAEPNRCGRWMEIWWWASLDIGLDGMGTVDIENNGQLTAGDTTIGTEGRLSVDPAIVYVTGNFVLEFYGVLSLDVAGFDFTDRFTPQRGESFDPINVVGNFDMSHATIVVEGLIEGFAYTARFREASSL